MASAAPWRVIDIINWGKKYFAEKGIESPRLTIELLLSHVLGCSRMGLYSAFERLLAGRQLAELKDCVKRKAGREPLQYITGKAQFMGLELDVGPGVLIPRPETEQMVSIIIEYYKMKPAPKRILDIGCGSGCIAVSLAKALPDAAVMCIDISPEALKTAAANAAKNHAANVSFALCDILKNHASIPYIDSKRYDLVVSNPPYIDKAEHDLLDPEVRIYEPAEALTDFGDGLTFYRQYARIFRDVLTEVGIFFVETGWGQKKVISDIFDAAGIENDILNDFGGVPRFLTNARIFPKN